MKNMRPISEKDIQVSAGMLGELTVRLVRKRIRNINLRVSESVIRVSAPPSVSEEYIREFILTKAGWIAERLKAREAGGRGKEIVIRDGENIPLLGQEYQVRITAGKAGIVLSDGMMVISAPEGTDNEGLKKIYGKWFALNAVKNLTEIFYKLLSRYNDVFPGDIELKVRKMKNRWGSCYLGKRRIALNAKLYSMPFRSIEYVVMHELCHLRHPNHSKAFYAFLAGFIPDWKVRKKELYERQ